MSRGGATPLESLLLDSRTPDSAVAFDSTTILRWPTFQSDVAGLCARLRRSPAKRWLVVCEDSYGFAVALFAVAHAGAVAVLPPNSQPGTLASVAGEVEGCIADDRAPWPNSTPGEVLAPLGHAGGDPTSLDALDPEVPVVEFYTSGTTGEGKRVPKRLRHLSDEVAVLEQTFGPTVDDARVFATVSHQHIYGALFCVLWPLAGGRAFPRRRFLHAGEAMAQAGGGAAALVSSPVQLRAMADGDKIAAARPAAIFSSGAPLDSRTAIAVAAATGVAVTEVFGSTETGGVAWRRCPDGGDQPWQPFAGVDIDVDPSGNLAVCSPLVSVGEADARGLLRFVMGDRAVIDPAGTFVLRGRSDRIVKIGGKRLSLPEMERRIAANPLVDEVALVVAQRGLEARVGAVAVLSDAGAMRLRAVGRTELGRELSAGLQPYFDRVHLPRLWRFVAHLPRNPQGKLTDTELRAVLDSEPAAGSRNGTDHGKRADVPAPGNRPKRPRLMAERRDTDRLHRRCAVPADLVFLSGHFDGNPIVAGVVQLGWAVDAAAELLGGTPRIASVEALKFKRPLRPEEEFDLEVTVDRDHHCVRFRLSDAGEEISSGRILLA